MTQLVVGVRREKEGGRHAEDLACAGKAESNATGDVGDVFIRDKEGRHRRVRGHVARAKQQQKQAWGSCGEGKVARPCAWQLGLLLLGLLRPGPLACCCGPLPGSIWAEF